MRKEKILILNLPGLVLKAGSRWYNKTKKEEASLKYYPYPWFMGYTTSLLKKHGYNTKFVDAVAMEWTLKETLDFINESEPTHIICEPTWVSVDDDVKLFKQINQNIKIIAVGNYATNYPEECLKKTSANYVVIGEYEFSILDFFKNKEVPKNFISKSKEKYSFPKLYELDDFPFPERDDVPNRYYNEPSCYGRNVVMVSSRGCRFQCSFCNVECVYGQHIYRTRSAKNVVEEIKHLQKNYKFDEIYFDDDNMVASKEHIDGICKEIIKQKIKVSWLCMGDARVDDETLELLAKAGCKTYKFGLEHLDENVLKQIPKNINPNRSLEIIKKTKKLGIKSYANLIVGLPGSTAKSDREMLEKVFAAKPDLIQIGIATPYPGTKFYKKAKKEGWLVSDDPRSFDVTSQSAVNYPQYSAKEITRIFNEGWKKWYKHVMFNQPKTLWFFMTSEAKRNGILPTMRKSFYYLLKSKGNKNEKKNKNTC